MYRELESGLDIDMGNEKETEVERSEGARAEREKAIKTVLGETASLESGKDGRELDVNWTRFKLRW